MKPPNALYTLAPSRDEFISVSAEKDTFDVEIIIPSIEVVSAMTSFDKIEEGNICSERDFSFANWLSRSVFGNLGTVYTLILAQRVGSVYTHPLKVPTLSPWIP